MERIKVLVITHENDLSGANKSLLSLILQLKDNIEFDVLVNEKKGELSTELKNNDINLIYRKYSWCYAHNRISWVKKIYHFVEESLKYYKNRSISKEFMQYLKNQNYSLVYTNTSTVDIGYYISKSLNLPHIWHIREFGQEDFGFQNICTIRHYNIIYGSADYIIAISKAIKEKYINFIGADKIGVIYNGFDVKKLSKKQDKIFDSDNVNILIVGQVCSAKRQDVAIKACKILISQGYKIVLHVAGNVDYDYLKRAVPEYNKLDWLKFHGMVDNIFELRNIMDIELICSRCEAFGRVTIEAMLHEIPVIGPNTGGTAELIINGYTGLSYEYGKEENLAECIEMLINNQKLMQSLKTNAKKFANEFTIRRTADEVYKIFCRYAKN